MREIAASSVTEAVRELCIEANTRLPRDHLTALHRALADEESPLGREVIERLLENAEVARERCIAFCQDTGYAVFWINFQLRSLGEIARADSSAPRLVLGHIPAPHQPTSFGPNGEPIVVPISRLFYADSPLERGEPLDEFARRYRDQLAYLNERFLETIDEIMANSEQPPVIVLWADHGSASRTDWVVTTPDEADRSALRERTSILFAALTPGQTNLFPNDIAPLNIFRFLADAYLGTDLGPAPPLASGP